MNLFSTILRAFGLVESKPLVFDRPRSIADWDVTCQKCKNRIVVKKARFRHETQDWACQKCERYNTVQCEFCDETVPISYANYCEVDPDLPSYKKAEFVWVCRDCEQD